MKPKRDDSMKAKGSTNGLSLAFHGAAGTVTGSRHLLKAGKAWVLVDIGMFQGLKKLRLLNWKMPSFNPSRVDHLLLTHAHIDHSGYLPRLVRDGYKGPIHCTKPTRELVDLLLMDSAEIQEEDAAYANRKGFTKHKPALPLYTKKDAREALKHLRVVRYGKWLDLGKGVQARFHNAGHILGSGLVEARVETEGREHTVVFSGDVGRYDFPLHTDPDPLPPCDTLVIESTYGNRTHEAEPLEDQLRDPILRTIEKRGVVLIPSFAVGRSQLIILILLRMMESGDLPRVPIHLDSPMAVDVTRIYSRYLHSPSLDDDVADDGRELIFPEGVQFHKSVSDSKRLNDMKGPRIIVSPSGMMTGGRILHHLCQRLPDPRTLVILAGFQAQGTRGRALLEGAETLRMHGCTTRVQAEVLSLHGISGHADKDELLRWIGSSSRPPREVFVTHGEPEASQELSHAIKERFGAKMYIPKMDEEFELNGHASRS
jgi:metallo-beta-lactamase family protein